MGNIRTKQQIEKEKNKGTSKVVVWDDKRLTGTEGGLWTTTKSSSRWTMLTASPITGLSCLRSHFCYYCITRFLWLFFFVDFIFVWIHLFLRWWRGYNPHHQVAILVSSSTQAAQHTTIINNVWLAKEMNEHQRPTVSVIVRLSTCR